MDSETYAPETIKRMFDDRGLSISEWARANGFRREDVYGVLSGRLKGRRGIGHEIAIALRIKAEPPENSDFLGLVSSQSPKGEAE